MKNYTTDENALKELRNERRLTKRITFDCKHCKERDYRASCPNHKLCEQSDDGSYDLHKILQGWTAKYCKTCPDYTSMGGMEA